MREPRDGAADQQRIPEMQARHGGDRVVQTLKQLRAEIERAMLADRVLETGDRQPGRRDRIEHVHDESKRRHRDQRCADERERATMRSVDPGEDSDRARDVERRVKDRERIRKRRNPLAELLHCALGEDAYVLLEADNLRGMLARQCQIDASESAHELVDAVQRCERSDLAPTRVEATHCSSIDTRAQRAAHHRSGREPVGEEVRGAADHEVGGIRGQRVGEAAAVDADDETEAG